MTNVQLRFVGDDIAADENLPGVDAMDLADALVVAQQFVWDSYEADAGILNTRNSLSDAKRKQLRLKVGKRVRKSDAYWLEVAEAGSDVLSTGAWDALAWYGQAKLDAVFVGSADRGIIAFRDAIMKCTGIDRARVSRAFKTAKGLLARVGGIGGIEAIELTSGGDSPVVFDESGKRYANLLDGMKYEGERTTLRFDEVHQAHHESRTVRLRQPRRPGSSRRGTLTKVHVTESQFDLVNVHAEKAKKVDFEVTGIPIYTLGSKESRVTEIKCAVLVDRNEDERQLALFAA